MRYSKLIQQAIDFATDVHKSQTRKGKDVPYVVHVLSVGLILSRVTDDENIIAVGILHDSIEDCKPYGSVTKEIIEDKFNADVARMVDDVTEKEKDSPWLERKMAALEHIQHMQKDSILVKSADVLHNLTELVQDIEKDGEKIWERFNASKADTIKRYDALIPELSKTWEDNPLAPDLQAAHQHLKELVNEKD